MTPYLTGRFYNPSAPYALARSVRADVEGARATVARCIGACGLAPVMIVGGDVYGKITPDQVADILKKYA